MLNVPVSWWKGGCVMYGSLGYGVGEERARKGLEGATQCIFIFHCVISCVSHMFLMCFSCVSYVSSHVFLMCVSWEERIKKSGKGATHCVSCVTVCYFMCVPCLSMGFSVSVSCVSWEKWRWQGKKKALCVSQVFLYIYTHVYTFVFHQHFQLFHVVFCV